jgi:alpha-glucoside transport system substrate-binding protein
MSRRSVVGLLLAAGLLISACATPDEEISETITVFGPYRGRSADLFQASLEDFALANNVTIRYTGTADFVNDLRRRVSDADPPDLAVIPQPGLIRELWNDGRIRPLSSAVVTAVQQNYGPESRALGEVGGTPVGVLYRANVKSLVWYRPSVFAEAGYSVPTSLDELETLSARMVSDGLAPWCVSIESRGATGWVATDWVEDLLVRRSGPEVYQQWVTGEVSFSDARVADVFSEFSQLALTQGRPAGGLSRVLRTQVSQAASPLFASPAGCGMHRQASFAGDWLPSGITYGDPKSDLEIFVLPGVTPGSSVPLLVGGDQAVAFSERQLVQDLLVFLATPASSEAWSESGAFFSPRIGEQADGQRDPLAQLQADLITNADVVVFDGSDQMDTSYSTDLFWPLVTQWVSGSLSYAEFAQAMDEARPQAVQLPTSG